MRAQTRHAACLFAAMSHPIRLGFTLIAALAFVSACDSKVEDTRAPVREPARPAPEAAGGGSAANAASSPAIPAERSDNASTRGEKIEEAHRTAPENKPENKR